MAAIFWKKKLFFEKNGRHYENFEKFENLFPTFFKGNFFTYLVQISVSIHDFAQTYFGFCDFPEIAFKVEIPSTNPYKSETQKLNISRTNKDF